MKTDLQAAIPDILRDGMALYVHIPFCKTKCPYCDFNTYQSIEHLMEPYLEALTTEISLWGRVLAHPAVNSVFFGGGTPSYLPEGHLDRILAASRSAFALKPDVEITIEGNPGDLDLDRCRRLLDAGVNRLSIGVQSLDNGLLALLGRRHSADQAIEAFETARTAGFANVNLDLMYGLPRQTLLQWQNTLRRVVSQSPTHVSLYALTLEEGTPLQRWVQTGKLPEPDPDLAADMYQYAVELLDSAGYHHYEISNWARTGFACQHNHAYWLNQPYLGVGPGAHSSLGSYRFWDISSPVAYMAQVKKWQSNDPQPASDLSEEVLKTALPVGGHEYISPETSAAEAMILGLRLLDGMDLEQASSRMGTNLAERYHHEIEDLVELGLLEWQENHLRLVPSAYLIANQVFTRFVE